MWEGQEKVKEDQWVTPTDRYEAQWWKGKTVFYTSRAPRRPKPTGQDEVNVAKESAQDRAEWKLSDRSEWNKVTQSGAVQVLDLEESRRVRHGKTRVERPRTRRSHSATKIARRYKPGEQPGEQPGEPAVKKSRLCIRGDLDPDILDLERFSPTLNTVNFNVQIAANEGPLARPKADRDDHCRLFRASGRPVALEKNSDPRPQGFGL